MTDHESAVSPVQPSSADTARMNILTSTLARLPSGVVVVTARLSGQCDTAIVASSCAPLSAGSSLVLWTMDSRDPRARILEQVRHWAINVLAYDQQTLAQHFEAPDENGLATAGVREFFAGIPIIPGSAAGFVCRRVSSYLCEDNLIFVGEVVHCWHADLPPLIRHDGKDAIAVSIDERPSTALTASAATSLSYLLGSSFFYLYGQLRDVSGRLGFNNIEMFVLTALGERGWRSRREIDTLLADGGQPTSRHALDDLEARGLIISREQAAGTTDEVTFDLTEAGHEIFVRFSRIGVQVQAEMETLLGMPENLALRALLCRFVKKIKIDATVTWL